MHDHQTSRNQIYYHYHQLDTLEPYCHVAYWTQATLPGVLQQHFAAQQKP